MRKLIAGNWKMNGLKGALDEIDAVIDGLVGAHEKADILICPPATLLNVMACLLYTSPSPRDLSTSRMPSSA